MEDRIKVICPYCGHENSVRVQTYCNGAYTRDMISCDNETGGCDQDFVYTVVSRVSYSVEVHKIDWNNELAIEKIKGAVLDDASEAMRRGW